MNKLELAVNAAKNNDIERVIKLLEEVLAEPELNLNCKSVQKRLATSWGYVKAEQAEQEPVAWMSENGLVITDKGAANVWIENGFAVEPLYKATPPPSQKPIAWWNGAYDITMNSFEAREDWTPLYAAPVRTKDLSDDEIISALGADMDTDEDKEWFMEIARLGIAADREKNRV